MMESERLIDSYNRYFEVVRASTPELMEEVFRLRYQVYCIEHNFEKAEVGGVDVMRGQRIVNSE